MNHTFNKYDSYLSMKPRFSRDSLAAISSTRETLSGESSPSIDQHLTSTETSSSLNSITPVSVEVTPQPSILAYFRPEKKNAKNIVEKKMSINSCILFKFKNFV